VPQTFSDSFALSLKRKDNSFLYFNSRGIWQTP